MIELYTYIYLSTENLKQVGRYFQILNNAGGNKITESKHED